MHILNFIIAHEFGHIVHGHLLVKSSKGFVEEFYNESEILQNEENVFVRSVSCRIGMQLFRE